jgi:hypothetical protein
MAMLAAGLLPGAGNTAQADPYNCTTWTSGNKGRYGNGKRTNGTGEYRLHARCDPYAIGALGPDRADEHDRRPGSRRGLPSTQPECRGTLEHLPATGDTVGSHCLRASAAGTSQVAPVAVTVDPHVMSWGAGGIGRTSWCGAGLIIEWCARSGWCCWTCTRIPRSPWPTSLEPFVSFRPSRGGGAGGARFVHDAHAGRGGDRGRVGAEDPTRPRGRIWAACDHRARQCCPPRRGLRRERLSA